MKCIIPAAGFGIRMNLEPHQSKEMLEDEFYYDHIIDYSLELCKLFKMEPLVITREEKQDLRTYLTEKGVKFIDIKSEGEWNHSVLASKGHWNDNNMLILPDTRFGSYKCIEDAQKGLEMGNNAVLALHKVEDPQNWGIVRNYRIYEKPRDLTGPQMAWGFIGFKSYYGEELFTDMSNVHLKNTGFVYLNSFEDITRIPLDKKS